MFRLLLLQTTKLYFTEDDTKTGTLVEVFKNPVLEALLKLYGSLIVFSITFLFLVIFVIACGLVMSKSIYLNRMGIVFQIIGSLSAIVSIIGKQKRQKIDDQMLMLRKKTREIRVLLKTALANPQKIYLSENPFLFKGTILSNYFISFILIILALIPVPTRTATIGGDQAKILLTCLAILWALLATIFLISIVKKFEPPKWFLRAFIFVHLIFSPFAAPFTFATLWIYWVVVRTINLILKAPFEKIISGISLPFIIFGSLFQLIATFY